MVAFSWPWKKESIGVVYRYKDSWNDPNYRCLFDTHVHSASLAIAWITIVGTVVGTISSFIINFISFDNDVTTSNQRNAIYALVAWAFVISISCNTGLVIANKKKIVLYYVYLIGNVLGIGYCYFASLSSVALALLMMLSNFQEFYYTDKSLLTPIYLFVSFVTFIAFGFQVYSFKIVRRDLRYVQNILLNPSAHE
ncbi:hypothetical protein M3Y98_01003700 [Aphelenchoides besseyi]|nr:hypothetical protein M3Y98_01003700 [Aphelenchoides besseyi]KAI6195180.1 hypothetical protein M3Y96_01203500 [Aphelenchoides besseyi]